MISMMAGETKYIEMEILDATAEELSGSTINFYFDDVAKTGTLNGNIFTIKLEPSDTINKNKLYKFETKITDAQGNISYPKELQGSIIITKALA